MSFLFPSVPFVLRIPENQVLHKTNVVLGLANQRRPFIVQNVQGIDAEIREAHQAVHVSFNWLR